MSSAINGTAAAIGNVTARIRTASIAELRKLQPALAVEVKRTVVDELKKRAETTYPYPGASFDIDGELYEYEDAALVEIHAPGKKNKALFGLADYFRPPGVQPDSPLLDKYQNATNKVIKRALQDAGFQVVKLSTENETLRVVVRDPKWLKKYGEGTQLGRWVRHFFFDRLNELDL
jgi:hypothetical protein